MTCNIGKNISRRRNEGTYHMHSRCTFCAMRQVKIGGIPPITRTGGWHRRKIQYQDIKYWYLRCVYHKKGGGPDMQMKEKARRRHITSASSSTAVQRFFLKCGAGSTIAAASISYTPCYGNPPKIYESHCEVCPSLKTRLETKGKKVVHEGTSEAGDSVSTMTVVSRIRLSESSLERCLERHNNHIDVA